MTPEIAAALERGQNDGGRLYEDIYRPFISPAARPGRLSPGHRFEPLMGAAAGATSEDEPAAGTAAII